MERIRAFVASLYWTALSLAAFPVLAYAQGTNVGSAPSPSGAAPSNSAGGPDTGGAGGAGWLWIIAALVVLAIIWWGMSSRRRHGTVAR